MKEQIALWRGVFLISLFLSGITSFAQNPSSPTDTRITVNGRVTDANASPVEGVTVQEKGRNNTAVSNREGRYQISVTSSNAVLVFTSVGFATREVSLAGRTNLDLALTTAAGSLQDIVVVGYGTQRRKDVTGATSSVGAEKIREVPTTNVSQALQGRIAGLVSTPSSFQPGAGSQIRIRGNRSLVASNDPLVVVDGVPITASIDDINPLDIETIDVLKDASATAIYGSRGANGVIQITTKKGRSGKVTVEYDGKVSFDRILQPLDVFSASEYADMKRLANNFYFPDPKSDSVLFWARADYYTWQSVASGYSWRDQSRLIPNRRPTTAAEKDLMRNLGLAVLDSLAIYDPSRVGSYDWQQHGLQTGITNNHNISVNGGSEKFRAAFSGNFFNQKGIQPGQDFTRYTFNLSADMRPNKTFNIGGGILFSTSVQNSGPNIYLTASNQLPIAKPYDSLGTFNLFPGNDANIVNPLNDEKTMLNESRVNRAIPNVFVDVNLLKGLKFRTAANIDISNVRQGTFNGAVSSNRAGTPANASYRTRLYYAWVLQNFLTYDRRFGNHSLNVVAGQEFYKNRFEENSASADNLIFESQKWYSLQNNSATTPNQAQGTFTQFQQWSAFGRANYGFKDKYLLTLSVRDDWHSALPVGKQHQVFPSGSAAWRIDQEPFMDRLPVFNELKLRVGYGEVGNATIAPYESNGTLARTPYNFGGNSAQGYAPSTLPLDITWERTKNKNIGLDFALLNNRIFGTVNLYQTNTNQILAKRLPSTSGFTSVRINAGDVRNRGIEVNLSTVNINRPDGLRWTTDFVFGYNKEEIVALETASDNISSQWFIGQPTSVYYDWKHVGIFQ